MRPRPHGANFAYDLSRVRMDSPVWNPSRKLQKLPREGSKHYTLIGGSAPSLPPGVPCCTTTDVFFSLKAGRAQREATVKLL